MNERELRDALRRTTADDAAARDRAWRVVQAAYREHTPPRRSRRWARVAAVAMTLTVAAGAAGAAATTPHSGVGRLVRDVLGAGEPHARAALLSVPGGGRLLVQGEHATWIVAADGTRRRLGPYAGASWSPHGMYVIAWRDGDLTATEPSGRIHWSLSRPGRITAARWSPVDGFRVAYLSGDALRVVNGDGTGDHRYGAARTGVAPAWRPDGTHVLAYVDAERRVNVVAVDARKRLWRSAPVTQPVALGWSATGGALMVLARQRIVTYDEAGRRVASDRLTGGQAAAWSPREPVVAAVRANATAGTSELVVLDAERRLRERLLFSGPGRFGAPVWSPDGRSVLLPWRDAGQWLFLHPGRSGRPTAVANIARHFSPGATRPRFPSAVEWCCRQAQP